SETSVSRTASSRLSSSQGPCALDGKANNHSALSDHSRMKLWPVFMLTINLMLQMDQRIHSVGKRNHFHVTIDLDPAAAVKRLRKDAKGSARVAPQVVDLICGFPAADDHPTITIPSLS